MDKSTLLAALSGAVVVFLSMAAGGDLPLFWNLPSVGIVLGGTASALFVQYSFSQVRGVVRAVRAAYFHRPPDAQGLIDLFVRLVEKARGRQFLLLEDELDHVRDPLLRQGLQGVVDFMPPEELQEMLDHEISAIADRFRLGQSFFKSMALLAPGFGMLGTLIGLIEMLHSFSDPAAAGPALAVALITTFYGALISNLVANPVAGKLRLRGEEELKFRLMMLDGVLLLQEGTMPRAMRERLRAHLSPYMRRLPPGLAAEAGDERAAGAREAAAAGQGVGTSDDGSAPGGRRA